MTEFEWRRRMRELRLDSEPPARVWAAIASRIDDAAQAPASANPLQGRTRPRRRDFAWRALAAAASVVMIVAIARVAAPTRDTASMAASPGAAVTGERRDPAAVSELEVSENLARNPVLAATDAELRDLQEQLRRAIAEEPGSVRLRRMLMRTEHEHRRLLQYQSQLG